MDRGEEFTVGKPGAGRYEAIVSEAVVESVMLVEGDGELRHTLATALRSEAFYVVEAAGGATALQLLRDMRGSVEWLITNVDLPTLSGLHVAFEFRFTHPTRPIIFMTEREVPNGPDLLQGSMTLRPPFSMADLMPLMDALRENKHRASTIGL
ncbi:response regulator [uncultured Enterovirga sp.]|uniref:response regulator n=1 Tax=uncultured Enterovirga sp. TaxID=2026352 RepID=UPI0035CC39AC